MERITMHSEPEIHESQPGVILNVLDLFSGIGGLALGLEQAGMRLCALCEKDEYCRSVLARRFPGALIYDDVKTLTAGRLRADGIVINAIAGGFPCQDISFAGLGAGLSGNRSSLWYEYARLIGELGPDIVLVENVAALLHRGVAEVLGTLSSLGYDAEWDTVSACSVGQPHVRRRLFIVAYTNGFNGKTRIRDSLVRVFRTLQTGDNWESAKARERAWMADSSALCRGANGVPYRLERTQAIGNSVAPAVARTIGEAILMSKDR